MSLRMGLFEQFKDADTVLISGSPADIADLSTRLAALAASGDVSLSIHGLAEIPPRHRVELFAIRDVTRNVSGHGWNCSPDSISGIQEKLVALVQSGSGHQYFDLLDPSVQLMVSVGEYDEPWWSSRT